MRLSVTNSIGTSGIYRAEGDGLTQGSESCSNKESDTDKVAVPIT